MATHALLLSGDEKTVQAVTQVLEELDFAFERSSELSSGANTLAHQHFDVILVDCDDKESATAVFNCVRGATLHKTAITIAIVNGQAGVPNAFRLGASVAAAPARNAGPTANVSRAIGHAEAQSAHAANPAVLPPQSPHSDAADSPAGKPQAVSSARPNSPSAASSAPPAAPGQVRPLSSVERTAVNSWTKSRRRARPGWESGECGRGCDNSAAP